jgi:hypothetical protein
MSIALMDVTMTKNEKKTIEELAAAFLPFGWEFRWAKSGELGSDLGICHYYNKTIVLKAQRQSAQVILQTLSHEIGHALTPGHSHDMVWWNAANHLDGPLQKELRNERRS